MSASASQAGTVIAAVIFALIGATAFAPSREAILFINRADGHAEPGLLTGAAGSPKLEPGLD